MLGLLKMLSSVAFAGVAGGAAVESVGETCAEKLQDAQLFLSPLGIPSGLQQLQLFYGSGSYAKAVESGQQFTVSAGFSRLNSAPLVQWRRTQEQLDADADDADFTLLMIDADAPDRDARSGGAEAGAAGPWLHWALSGCRCTTTACTLPGSSCEELMSYSGPAPPRGNHRYIFLLLAERPARGFDLSGASSVHGVSRMRWDLRGFLDVNKGMLIPEAMSFYYVAAPKYNAAGKLNVDYPDSQKLNSRVQKLNTKRAAKSDDDAADLNQIMDVNISVVHRTSPNYLSVTVDGSSLMGEKWKLAKQAFGSRTVMSVAKALRPGFLRMGGTANNFVIFNESTANEPPPAQGAQCAGAGGHKNVYTPAKPFAMGSCQWSQVLAFANETGLDTLYGLNVLTRPRHGVNDSRVGPWNASNALALIAYSKRHFPGTVKGWEAGNEPEGWMRNFGMNVTMEAHYQDFVTLRTALPDALLVGPDYGVAGCVNDHTKCGKFKTIVQLLSNPPLVNMSTYH